MRNISGTVDGNPVSLRFCDGSSLTKKTDGSMITKLSAGKQITEKPDGSTITENIDGTWFIAFPKKADGTHKTYHSDGSCKDAAGNTIPC